MSKGVSKLNNKNLSCDFDVIPLLSLAEYYGELRQLPGIWGTLLTDLLKLPGYTTARIAQLTELGARSISRLIHGQSKNPGFIPGFIIMLLHMQAYKHRYLALFPDRDA